MYTLEIEIEGVSPLLQHRYTGEKGPGANDERQPEEIASESLYKTPKGILYHPSDALRVAMGSAAAEVKMEGKRNRTWKKAVLGGVRFSPAEIPIEPQKWTVDSRRVVIPATRGAVIRHRPRFDDWKMNVQMIVTNDELQPKMAVQLLERAGMDVGIADNRLNGYGRFKVAISRKKK